MVGRKPAKYFEFRNVRIHKGAIVFASPDKIKRQPINSPINFFSRLGLTIAVDYQTADAKGSSPLAKCVS